MSTPRGVRAKQIRLATGDAVHVYSNGCGIVLQLRRTVATEEELTATSFKVAAALLPAEAISLAGELLTVAAQQLQSQGDKPESKRPVGRRADDGQAR